MPRPFELSKGAQDSCHQVQRLLLIYLESPSITLRYHVTQHPPPISTEDIVRIEMGTAIRSETRPSVVPSLRVHSMAQVSFVRDTLTVPSTKTAAPARRNAERCVHVQTVQRECAEGGMPTFRQTAAVNARKCKSHGSPYAAVLHEPAPGRHSILAMDAVPAPPAPLWCISAKQTRPSDGSS